MSERGLAKNEMSTAPVVVGIDPVDTAFLGAAFLNTPLLEQRLTGEAAAALKSAGVKWANIEIDGRDARLSGEAPSAAAIGQAVGAVGGVHGIRLVDSRKVTLAARVIVSPPADALEDTAKPAPHSRRWRSSASTAAARAGTSAAAGGRSSASTAAARAGTSAAAGGRSSTAAGGRAPPPPPPVAEAAPPPPPVAEAAPPPPVAEARLHRRGVKPRLHRRRWPKLRLHPRRPSRNQRHRRWPKLRLHRRRWPTAPPPPPVAEAAPHRRC